MCAHACRWLVPHRNKKPSSLSLEASSIVRLLEFMGAAARLDEASRSDLERLKASLRRLAAQLNAMHRPTTSIASLEAAGKWADHELVQEKVRAEANAVLMASESASHRDPRLARRVHDSLLSTLVGHGGLCAQPARLLAQAQDARIAVAVRMRRPGLPR